MVDPSSGRATLLESIRQAGGIGKAKLRSVKERKLEKKKQKEQEQVRATSQGGDLMSDLFNKLAMRRKGISGKGPGSGASEGPGEPSPGCQTPSRPCLPHNSPRARKMRMTGSPRAGLTLPQVPGCTTPPCTTAEPAPWGTGSWRTLQLSCWDLQGARRLLSEAKLGRGGGIVAGATSAFAPAPSPACAPPP